MICADCKTTTNSGRQGVKVVAKGTGCCNFDSQVTDGFTVLGHLLKVNTNLERNYYCLHPWICVSVNLEIGQYPILYHLCGGYNQLLMTTENDCEHGSQQKQPIKCRSCQQHFMWKTNYWDEVASALFLVDVTFKLATHTCHRCFFGPHAHGNACLFLNYDFERTYFVIFYGNHLKGDVHLNLCLSRCSMCPHASTCPVPRRTLEAS